MLRIYSTGLWAKIRILAAKASRREAAIAYVTRDHISFKKGDRLVVNAHTSAIASGETDAKLLRKLHKRGVKLYSNRDLHAKVLLLGDTVVVGSGNMSGSSEATLVEAAIISDNPSLVSGTTSLIEQLAAQSAPIDSAQLAKLCQIKVVRKGGWGGGGSRKRRRTKIQPLGAKTWLIGVYEDLELSPKEKAYTEKAAQEVAQQEKVSADDINFIRCSTQSRFDRLCQNGDTLIQIWRQTPKAKPTMALRPIAVLRKDKRAGKFYFYIRDASGRRAEMKWGQFKKLLKAIGYTRKVGPYTERQLAPEVADAITLQWKAHSK